MKWINNSEKFVLCLIILLTYELSDLILMKLEWNTFLLITVNVWKNVMQLNGYVVLREDRSVIFMYYYILMFCGQYVYMTTVLWLNRSIKFISL